MKGMLNIMKKKQFKAESKKLLDLMINSIYTNKEIFLRELISNSSDALDKLYYKSLEEGYNGVLKSDFYIRITPDLENHTLTISDNGIGMTKEELENNLGTIAKSGSQSFKANLENTDNPIDIIGQFGVGFYSAFMVADKVSVTSKAYGDDTAWIWESEGADGYTITESAKKESGTEIVLKIKEDTEQETYSEFLDEMVISTLVKKYSDYIRYPIKMMVTRQRPAENGEYIDEEKKIPKLEIYQEDMVLNSMEPIWKRSKDKVSDEEYNEFYKEKFMDYQDPARVIRMSVEGLTSYTALLFIPSHIPYNYYTKDFKKGLELYSSNVMIMEKCEALLPDYFNFVTGIVDSQDLSLNISRETLQQDRQLRFIEKNLEKKIKNELLKFMEEDRAGYEEFFENFGKQIKFGMYENFGMNKDLLQDLVLFYSSTEKKLVTLKEYVSRMKDDQENIYYASGDTVDNIDLLPQTEYIKSKGYEILYLTDELDEFVIQMIRDYDEKPFMSTASEEIAAGESEEEKQAIKSSEEKNKDMLTSMEEILGDKVAQVKLTNRLKSSAVFLTTKGDLSLEMEKVINAMPMDQKIKAERVLEINNSHPVLEALKTAFENDDKETFRIYTELLYDQAALVAGVSIDNPVKFSEDICKLIVR